MVGLVNLPETDTPDMPAKDMKKYMRDYRKKNPDYVTEDGKRANQWKKENPRKAKAQDRVEADKKSGKLKKPERCSRCGKKTDKLEVHHAGYGAGDRKLWLCNDCHADSTPTGDREKAH